MRSGKAAVSVAKLVEVGPTEELLHAAVSIEGPKATLGRIEKATSKRSLCSSRGRLDHHRQMRSEVLEVLEQQTS